MDTIEDREETTREIERSETDPTVFLREQLT